MKKIIFLIAFIVTGFNLFSQQRVPRVHDKDYYLSKKTSLNTTAWTLLGTGAAAITVGALVISNNQNSGNFNDGLSGTLAGALVLIVGELAVIGSVPLFIVAGAMKRKAARLSFNNPPLLFPRLNGFVAGMQPTLKLSIRF